MELTEQYKILGELKVIDEKIERLKKEQARIPVAIEKLEAELESHRSTFQTAKDKVESVSKSLRDSESELKAKETELAKAEEKMMEVKTNEEYSAAMKENENRKKAMGDLEEKVLLSMNALEDENKRLAEASSQFQAVEKENKAAVAELETDLKKLQTQHSEQEDLQKATMSGLDGGVKSTYSSLLSRVGGVSIVAAKNGFCTHCRMALLPQLFNEVLGKAKIHQCPGCLRILVAE